MVPGIPTPTLLSGFVLLLPICFLGFSNLFGHLDGSKSRYQSSTWRVLRRIGLGVSV